MSDAAEDKAEGTQAASPASPMAQRFRGFLPIIVDVETGGFNCATDALLEIAACSLDIDEQGRLSPGEAVHFHVEPFAGANIEEASLEVTGIRPFSPLRAAEKESNALGKTFQLVRRKIKEHGCRRAVLVGHNAHFDLGFVNAAVARCGIKRNPFHPFSVFDTATLAGAVLGQTVLSRAIETAGMSWDAGEAHSARYDAAQTAELFCRMLNSIQPAYLEWTSSGEPGS